MLERSGSSSHQAQLFQISITSVTQDHYCSINDTDTQYYTIPCSTMQYHAISWNTMHDAIPCCNAVPFNTMQCLFIPSNKIFNHPRSQKCCQKTRCKSAFCHLIQLKVWCPWRWHKRARRRETSKYGNPKLVAIPSPGCRLPTCFQDKDFPRVKY